MPRSPRAEAGRGGCRCSPERHPPAVGTTWSRRASAPSRKVRHVTRRPGRPRAALPPGQSSPGTRTGRRLARDHLDPPISTPTFLDSARGLRLSVLRSGGSVVDRRRCPPGADGAVASVPNAAITAAATAARSTMPVTVTCSCRAWAPPPTAPSPSRTGRPMAAAKLPSLAPPTDVSRSSNPSCSAARRASAKTDEMAAFGSMTGRFQPPRTATSARGRGASAPAAARRCAPCAATERTRTSTSACAVPATTFERVPPPHHTDVDGGARRRVGGRVQLQHEPRDLVDGARAGLRVEARVRLDPARVHLEDPDALAPGLQRAVRARLEHQHRGGVGAGLLDQRAREPAADLLVAVEQQAQRGVRQRRPRAAPAPPRPPAPARPSCRTRRGR